MKEIGKSLEESLLKQVEQNNKQIEEKLNSIINQNQTYKSYAEKVKDNVEVSNLESIIKETKNDDLVQERERELRSANLIIYGVDEAPEAPDNQTNPQVHDEKFISSFLEVIGVTSRPKQIMRLGKRNDNSKRPIKLVMNNTDDKEKVMSRLGNLKNADEVFRKLSVREDYTIKERELIREWVNKAERKNVEENTKAWKVRGTPKNGLRLVKITKQR
jgi:hypothetical protein